MPEIGYTDDEGRFCMIANLTDPIMPRLSDRMRVVLSLFFQSDRPYQLYGEAAQDTTDEDDNMFEIEVNALREWLAVRGKVKP